VLRLMLHGIGGELNHADVVAVDEGGAFNGAVEPLEKLAELGGLMCLNLNINAYCEASYGEIIKFCLPEYMRYHKKF
jgi:hypothetical protein